MLAVKSNLTACISAKSTKGENENMKMIAKTLKGKEFMYSRTHCYRVSEKGAIDICNALNEIRYNLKEGETWHIYDCGSYELNYTNAGIQKLTRYKGNIRAVRSYA